jgi:hypothetical protein
VRIAVQSPEQRQLLERNAKSTINCHMRVVERARNVEIWFMLPKSIRATDGVDKLVKVGIQLLKTRKLRHWKGTQAKFFQWLGGRTSSVWLPLVKMAP